MYIYNPANFDPSKILDPWLQKYAMHSRMLLSIILNKTIINQNNFISLSSVMLKKQIHDRMFVPIKNCLLKSKVIECDNTYCPKQKCYNYRIGKEYRNKKIVSFLVNKPCKENIIKMSNPVHKAIWKWLNLTQIDYNNASLFLEHNKKKKDSLKWLSLEKFKNKEFFLNEDQRGRVYHNVACMWNEFRQFLSINNSKLVNIDITNSQPLFFTILIFSYYTIYSPTYHVMPVFSKKDVHQYIDLVQQGKLYDFLMSELSIPENNRKSFKKRFFAEVFYSKLDYESSLTRSFAILFPTIYEIIRYYKKVDYRELPLSMQKIEADLMIGDVCLKLTEDHPEIPFLTIHDSILTIPEYVDKVKSLISDAFAKIKLSLRFK